MKRKLSLFMAAVLLFTTPASVSLASNVGDAVIVEDDAVLSVEDEVETEVAVSDETESTAESETEDAQTEENFIMSVEEADDPSDEPAAVTIVASGNCGNPYVGAVDYLDWTLDSDGTLTISRRDVLANSTIGYGYFNMGDYSSDITDTSNYKYILYTMA